MHILVMRISISLELLDDTDSIQEACRQRVSSTKMLKLLTKIIDVEQRYFFNICHYHVMLLREKKVEKVDS